MKIYSLKKIFNNYAKNVFKFSVAASNQANENLNSVIVRLRKQNVIVKASQVILEFLLEYFLKIKEMLTYVKLKKKMNYYLRSIR